MAIVFFFFSNIEKKATTWSYCPLFAISYRHLFYYNTTIKKDDSTLLSSSSFQTQISKTCKKTTKKNEEKGGSLPSSSHFSLSLLDLYSALCFCPSVSSAFSWLPLLPSCFRLLVLPSLFCPLVSSSLELWWQNESKMRWGR